MKLMGIDYGRRRIGVAITDENGCNIRGLLTIDRKKKLNPIQVLLDTINVERPQMLIIGLPLDTDDADTVMSKEIRSFSRELCDSCGLLARFIDESYSSKRAGELMMFRKKKTRRDKGAIDRLAACLILERYREEQECTY